ncbi:hypothetical protein BDV33DRAFT_198427 [Aspergillus novoparasiticus]|uniref:HPt domain-containing protein n=1 Tax=Aspergillus novoparasiticus TaxID=986946 RepID=A0A5N6F6J4_9EURO|nr:hypothetical protein BDV33DRAFT_198427 [Aspergillus novoparasiticus]
MAMTKLEGKLPSGSLDFSVFEYIISLDDSDENDFGQDIVFGFFERAEETFNSIEESLEEKDFETISKYASCLREPSEAIGLIKVPDGLLKVERYSLGQNEDGTEAPDSDDLDLRLERVREACETVKKDCGDVEGPFREFYEELEDKKDD